MFAGLIDKGWGDWWLADPGLAPTRVTQAQANYLLALEDGWEAGACEVRFGDATGELLVGDVAGEWWELSEDGAAVCVTEVVCGG